MACFGVAGNFAGHLEQAGELDSFRFLEKKRATNSCADENAGHSETDGRPVRTEFPKGIFPTYFPSSFKDAPSFLKVFPFSSEKIICPREERKIQMESECAVVFDVVWEDGKIKTLEGVRFGASNDCSIRKEGAVKISEKKNWGECSKGLSRNLIELSSFDEKSVLNGYRIASYLERSSELFEYGENSPVNSYSCMFKSLADWLVGQFNSQEDEGPLEDVLGYMKSGPVPSSIMVSIGATRYTDFGEKNFLRPGDASCVVLYPESKYSESQIRALVGKKDFSDASLSVLYQKII